jgi:hypothetical protein
MFEEDAATPQPQQLLPNTTANDTELPDDGDDVTLPGLGDVTPVIYSSTAALAASTTTATAEALVNILTYYINY